MLEMSILAIEKSGSDINVPQKRRKKTDPQESKEMAWDTYRWAVVWGNSPVQRPSSQFLEWPITGRNSSFRGGSLIPISA